MRTYLNTRTALAGRAATDLSPWYRFGKERVCVRSCAIVAGVDITCAFVECSELPSMDISGAFNFSPVRVSCYLFFLV